MKILDRVGPPRLSIDGSERQGCEGMSEAVRWWWVRHAPVDSGGRIYGAEDPPCDCSDTSLFSQVATLLPRDAIWITSHLQRTHQTARALLSQMPEGDAEPLVEARFGEQSFGRWHGLTREELRQQRHPQWHRFWHAPAEERPPGGESFLDLIGRVDQALQAWTDRYPGRDLVAVAHGGTIRAALAIALDLEPEAALRLTIDNCSLSCMEWIPGPAGSHFPDQEGVWRVSLVNFPPRSGA